LYIVGTIIIIVSLSEIISYLSNPDSYMLGSESMISNGGFKYESKNIFLLFYSTQIVISLFVFIFLFKGKQKVITPIAIILCLLQILSIVIA